ncbi:MAG: hypothetical protein KAV00_13485 [Phycisphaerae bacterium]|nr:hypothetical protein [Phycisphaerae bacterium]
MTPKEILKQTRRSKRHDGKPFLYWWDITPVQVHALEWSGDVEFVKTDTGERCVVPMDVLREYLVPEQQTTRAAESWGVKVLKNHEDELAFEPRTGKAGKYLFLPVIWINEREKD